MALRDWQNRLAGTRHVATEQETDPVNLEQTLRQASELLWIRCRIVNHRLDHAIEHTSTGVDLFNGEKGCVQLGLFDGAGNSCLRKQYPPPPWRIGFVA